jgi:hypothetical protein
MANADDSKDFLRVVDFVDHAVIAETDAPAFTLGQFFAPAGREFSCNARILSSATASCWAGKSASSLLARGKMRRP